jgi:hypothetical protein
MHSNHLKILSRTTASLQTRMISYFVGHGLLRGDVPGSSFVDVLRRARLCQADVVLCLLRLDSRQSFSLASRLVGRPVTYCPPVLALVRGPTPISKFAKLKSDRIVLSVVPPSTKDARSKRRLLVSPIYERIARIKVGMSVNQLMAHGVRQKDIRIALKRGYVKLSEVTT